MYVKMAIFTGRLLDVYKHSTLMMIMKMMMTKMSRILMMVRMTMIIIITSGTCKMQNIILLRIMSSVDSKP